MAEIAAARKFRADQLDGDGAAQTRIAGAKNLAHSALAQRGFDLVGPILRQD